MRKSNSVFESNSFIFSLIDSSIPRPCHKAIIEEVKSLSEEYGSPYGIFVSDTKWFETMYPGFQFYKTSLKSSRDLLEALEVDFNDVLVVDSSIKKPLFEDKNFYAIEKPHDSIPNLYSEFREEYNEYLKESEIRRLFSDIYPPKEYKDIAVNLDSKRERFHNGDIFNVGSFVEDSSGEYEVLSKGNNYVVVVNESGDVSKKFIQGLQESNSELEYNKGFFKGYTPSEKFMEREDIVESYFKTITDYEMGNVDDPYAIIKSMKEVDAYLNEDTQDLSSAYSSLKRIGQLHNHTYLEESNKDIHRDLLAMRAKSTKDVLKDHQKFRNVGVPYTAKDVGGKRAMINDMLSHNHGPSAVKEYKKLSAKNRRELTTEALNGTERSAENEWHSQISSSPRMIPMAMTKSKGYNLVSTKTNKVVSTHKSAMDAVSARKKLKGDSTTHKILAISEMADCTVYGNTQIEQSDITKPGNSFKRNDTARKMSIQRYFIET